MTAKRTESISDIYEKAVEKGKGAPPPEPIDLLVVAALQIQLAPEDAWSAMETLRDAFVDWNECRVTRRNEIAKILATLDNEADDAAILARNSLNGLFELRGMMDLSWVPECKPSEARKALTKIDKRLPRPLLGYILFALCPGTTIPITPEGLKEARKLGLVGRTGNKAQLQKALLAELTQEQAGRFVIRLEMDANVLGPGDGKPRRKKKTTKKSAATKGKTPAKKTTKKKATAKKSTTKKKK